MSPRDVLLANITDLLTAFADNCTPSQAYAKLVAMNSPVATMPFNSFKTTAPIVVATMNHVHATLAEREQELAYVTEAYNHTLQTLEATLSGYEEALGMIHDNGVQKHTPEMTEAQVVGIVQREIDKTFKAAGISAQKPSSGVYYPPDNYTPQANSFDEPVVITATPSVYKGWSVNRGADGYLRINRKLKCINKTIHVGREWNETKVQTKIDEFMRTLGV